MRIRIVLPPAPGALPGALLAAALLLLPAVPARADAEAALQFLKLGKAAIDKKQFADAVSRLKKALEEDPALIEAQYWLALALDKNDEKAGAIQAYRDFLLRVEEKGKKGAASKEETRLEGTARKRLNVLATGEAEFLKLEQAFVDELMKFAREAFLRDPASAVKALQALLQARPNHADALGLLKKLGGEPPDGVAEATSSQGPPGPFKKAKSWRDLVELKGFVELEGWSFQGRSMIIDKKDGCVARPKSFIGNGPSFAAELESRVLEEYERGWLMGLVFGRKSESFLTVFYQKSMVILHEALEPGGGTDLEKYVMPPVDLKAWHRLGALVRGNAVEVWFDGKKIISYAHPTRADFDGEFGLFHQRCKGEYRVFRLGKLD
ncbi:MAG: hypothetical protein MUC63_02485 [Planctomycetes bacterium]|jgi:tetratricopeptide (TPR) repeat protein|nr:hypothetical protein [Planctomycetota bacterium]